MSSQEAVDFVADRLKKQRSKGDTNLTIICEEVSKKIFLKTNHLRKHAIKTFIQLVVTMQAMEIHGKLKLDHFGKQCSICC